jgi:GT2 family glycosyltransferase
MADHETWTWEFKDPGPIPDVSVIVCAHGKSDVTMTCLASLVENQHFNTARAEIILVDDASPDDTLERTRDIRGLRLVELTKNVGFLRACNEGLAVARGQHILFLNNDTEQVGRWLDPLLETLDRRPDALVVGSRLVYPDGTLQEAGGIIFSDGSGWNYGRGTDPFDPRVIFERQVDYVSGASLLVRGDFIRGRGGFDERYAPAYYEDTDLCFAAREAGGQVWYQPASIVIHYEGQSNGTDESTGIKAYQPINREKFRQRWAEALVRHSAPDAANVPSARQRSAHGRILVIENEVPTPDRDSGSVRMTAVMQAMLDLGFAVTFLPANGWRRDPYTRRLERMGVEVLGVPDRWWPHIEEMAPGITHVWISRPGVAHAFLARARQSLPHATIVYDTVDLHFLRLEREAATTADGERRREALRQQIQELELIDLSDVAVVVSPHEQDLLRERTTSPVVVVPNVHGDYEHPVSLAGRSGMVFVGGFRHNPNEDAVGWFVSEILPRVTQRVPDAHLTIIGSEPTPGVLALEGEHVTVAGWVPDTLPLYESSRIAIAPLRYGAGVKGKVGEAMSLGVPMVMTPIASEGMHIEHGVHALVSADPHQFAEHVVTLLTDDDLWRRLSRAGQQLVHDRFGVEATRAMVEQALASGDRAKEMTWA